MHIIHTGFNHTLSTHYLNSPTIVLHVATPETKLMQTGMQRSFCHIIFLEDRKNILKGEIFFASETQQFNPTPVAVFY